MRVLGLCVSIDHANFMAAESAAIFLQQLGRGLRRTVGKDVLDCVGQQRKEFRFDLRYRRMLGRSRRHLVDDIDQGFP